MTNPLPHKCDNYSEPDHLRGDSDSKKYVSKYKQLLIPFCKLVNNVLSSSGNARFSFSFFK